MRRRLLSLGAGALVAFLATGALSPRAAAAGCTGHAVRTGGAQADPIRNLELLETSPGTTAPGAPAPDAPAPCHGVFCSGNPAPPLLPVAPTPPPPQEEWAIATVTDARPSSSSERSVPSDRDLRPLVRGPSVFHPPR